PTLLVISFVVYAILALAPGDPLSQFATNPNVPPELREHIREQLELNQPWHVRYVKWLIALVKGDFGYSFMSHLPVINLLVERLPNTLAVVVVAIVTEQICRVPGIGELLIRSINDSDTPVVAAIVFLFAVLVVLFNLIADVLYAVLDPRIRYA